MKGAHTYSIIIEGYVIDNNFIVFNNWREFYYCHNIISGTFVFFVGYGSSSRFADVFPDRLIVVVEYMLIILFNNLI